MMAHVRAKALFVIAGSVLTACGGGGGATGSGGGSSPTIPAPPPSTTPSTPTSATLGAAQALLDTHADPVSYATLSAVPTNGSATYSGYAYGVLSNQNDAITDSVVGALTATVTFNSTSVSVSGQIDSFEDADGDAMTGSLALSAASFDRSGDPSADPTLGITASGILTDDAARALTVGARLEGDFLGSGHAAIGGEFLGSVTVGGDTQDIDGGFIAER